jgi:DNA-binding NarL/FixJ family response regulator
MSSAPTPSSAIADIFSRTTHPLLVIDLHTMTIMGANDAAYELLGRAPHSLEGAPVTDIVRPADRASVEASLRLLATGAIDGYRAVRRIQKGDASEFTASVWAQITKIDGSKLALATLAVENIEVPWPPLDASVKIALAVTDHDWVIEHVSSDVERILGLSCESYEGSALLALLRPADVQSFMIAVGRVAAGEGAATLRVHLQTGKGQWQDVYCLVVTLCRHSPPRLGLAFAVIAEQGGGTTSDGLHQVADRAVDALDSMDQFRSHMARENFSTRQWEIFTRLVRGERVQDIADALYLSPSTVRNHLTAIYRKFGVHSQAELLAKLLVHPTD